ncbi:hypothetical protein GCM10019016_080290 [Streptomyces prasinosporus]|uniref:DUF2933 domain-containing protein n=2 Tax=Streptomyces TaxID=1883 RepID=A0ABP6U2I2_9ACTN|nr:hypothetical protein [Streptomyces tricolor]MCG0062144.1 hypothetical protein [Streptomyces tricolor]GHC14276.1 hypothetical protein GCM10010332_50500 [Streptomyces albogriseolus]
MDGLLYALPLLACPLVMGAMMWFMMRSKHGAQTAPAADRQELIRLRKGIEALRGELASRDTTRHDSPA